MSNQQVFCRKNKVFDQTKTMPKGTNAANTIQFDIVQQNPVVSHYVSQRYDTAETDFNIDFYTVFNDTNGNEVEDLIQNIKPEDAAKLNGFYFNGLMVTGHLRVYYQNVDRIAIDDAHIGLSLWEV